MMATVHQIQIFLMEYVRVAALYFQISARILPLYYQLQKVTIQKEKQV